MCLIVAFSGFSALSAEVVWTRLLSLLFGTTTYTFAIILAVFLTGIGIGSTVAAKIAERASRPFQCLALSQLALVLSIPHGMLGNAVIPRTWDDFQHLYETEGQNTAVAVQIYKGRPERYLCVSGKVVASTLTRDRRLQLMLGHLPALLHPQPKDTLTVGLGTGTTAGSFVLYPDIEQINVC